MRSTNQTRGIYASLRHSTTWTPTGPFFLGLVPVSARWVYSVDGASTWVANPNPYTEPSSSPNSGMAVNDTGVIIIADANATTTSGAPMRIHRSTDFTKTWQTINFPSGYGFSNYSPNTWWCTETMHFHTVAESGTTAPNIIYYSPDGLTWKSIAAPYNANTNNGNSYAVSGKGKLVICNSVRSTMNTVYYANWNNTTKTYGGWTLATKGSTNYINRLAYSPVLQRFVGIRSAGTSNMAQGNFFYSDDGVTWTQAAQTGTTLGGSYFNGIILWSNTQNRFIRFYGYSSSTTSRERTISQSADGTSWYTSADDVIPTHFADFTTYAETETKLVMGSSVAKSSVSAGNQLYQLDIIGNMSLSNPRRGERTASMIYYNPTP